MIKVFFCTLDERGHLRSSMANLCLTRWRAEGVDIEVVTPWSVTVWGDFTTKAREFQRERRVYANQCGGEYYVVADDDCLLPERQTLSIARMAMDFHPDFAVISYSLSNHPLGPWTSVPKGYKPYEDDEVVEHAAAGGIRVCRNVDFTWPPMRPHGRYDGIHAEALRKEGYRTGYFKHLYCNHIGEGYGSIV